jgi:DNA-binding MurR/RpiR family transcriptional regulator
VLIKVRGILPNLRPAEQRVAAAVLADPAGISESSITAVALRCQTSETAVLRFCRAIGLTGYPELRIALARAAQFEEVDHCAGAPMTGDITAGHAR